MSEKYGVVQCPICGVIQGRVLSGNVYNRKGKFKSVYCYSCLKPILLTDETILHRSDSAEEASQWVMEYKKTVSEKHD